ncbi:MAG: TIM barrel protein [Defluviitaleaceae bacterium]|nr:TIM barrel protein [Defluviitaleaceae bacterium]
MKFSVCTDALFSGMDTAQALAKCASLGFGAVEFWYWPSKDIEKIAAASKEHGVEIAGFCTEPMNLVNPARRGEFIRGLIETATVAQKLGAKVLITQVGDDTGQPRDAQRSSIIDGLKEAAIALKNTNLVLAIEPLNALIDHKGYYLTRSNDGFEIVKEVSDPHIKVLFDIYHQQVTEGNIVNNIEKNIEYIAHFHAAGLPGRHELTENELNYDYVLAQIDKMGYSGYIGLEYFPLAKPEKGLAALLSK